MKKFITFICFAILCISMNSCSVYTVDECYQRRVYYDYYGNVYYRYAPPRPAPRHYHHPKPAAKPSPNHYQHQRPSNHYSKPSPKPAVSHPQHKPNPRPVPSSRQPNHKPNNRH